MGFWDDINPLNWGKSSIDPSKAHVQDEGYLRGVLKGQIDTIGGRQAPGAGTASTMTGATIDKAAQDQFRQRQMSLADQLAGVASGQRKGAGEMGVQRQFGQGLAAQLANARMARGANAALGARSAARGIGDMTVNAAGQSAQAAMQDQGQAQGMLGQLLGQGRASDLDLASQQAGLTQQAGLANQQAQNQFKLADQAAKLQQMGMNDQAIATYLGQLYGMDAQQMAAQLGIEQGNQQQTGIFGDLLQAGGAIGAAYAGKP